MSGEYRQLKKRIRAVQNAEKVTSAMQMVSAAKMNRTDKVFRHVREYLSALDLVMSDMFACGARIPAEYMDKPGHHEDTIVCVMTSDNGLCGAYNNNIIRKAEEFIGGLSGGYGLFCVGRRGYNYFLKRGFNVIGQEVSLSGRYSDASSDRIAAFLINKYVSGKAGAVFVVYSKFQNILRQEPVAEKYLGLGQKTASSGCEDIILEPGDGRIMDEIIPKYLSVKISEYLLEAFISEHAARTASMNSATENAKELGSQLTLRMNKARQAAITQDIMEVISSSRALEE